MPSYKIDSSTKVEEYGIKGFPQIFYWRNGEFLKYQGERTEKELKSWIKRRLFPEVIEIVEEKTQLRSQAEFCRRYQSCLFARGIDKLLLIEVSRKVDIEIISVEGESRIMLYLNYAEEVINYNSTIYNISEIIEFVSQNLQPLVLPLEKKYLDPLFNKGGNALVLIRDKKNRYVESEITSLGSTLRGKMLLLIVDVSIPLGKQVQQVLRLPDRLIPCIRIIECKGGSLNITQYHMLDDLYAENILKFYSRWENGLLKPYILSQELPKKATDNRIVNLVWQNFKTTIYNDDKDVFVMFYAP